MIDDAIRRFLSEIRRKGEKVPPHFEEGAGSEDG
jgi:hypothetical protein